MIVLIFMPLPIPQITLLSPIFLEDTQFQPNNILVSKNNMQSPNQETDPWGTVFVYGTIAYIRAGKNLVLLDITNPTTPQFISTLTFSDLIINIFVLDNYAYLANSYDGLQIVDISDPHNPRRVGSHSISGSARGVQAKDNYVYMTVGHSGLMVYDVSNPTDPKEFGYCALSGYSWKLQVVGNYAYVPVYSSGFRVVDISNPSNPMEVDSIDSPNGHGVYVEGVNAYFMDAETGLWVMDTIDLTNR
ncbi:MAG: LVIVD repeat-containing protein [Candidatus Hermodarchaeota archaeon]